MSVPPVDWPDGPIPAQGNASPLRSFAIRQQGFGQRGLVLAVSLMLHLAELFEVHISAIRLDVSPLYQHRSPMLLVGSISAVAFR
jgi:hypothetical protein